MYHKGYGIIKTLAPLYVGATAGEETGNLNLIFRDKITQTGIIPGSSIRGRFRADMRLKRQEWLESNLKATKVEIPDAEVSEIEVESKGITQTIPRLVWLEQQAQRNNLTVPKAINDNYWYGQTVQGGDDNSTTEALVKFEYASLLWLPVFCPGQPVVWVTCPWLLRRYQDIANIDADVPKPYTAGKGLKGRQIAGRGQVLFFNLGFVEVEEDEDEDLSPWIPPGSQLEQNKLVVLSDNDIAMVHDMALYRQSRVKLLDEMKKVENFFNVEALPEASVLVFPIAQKRTGWKPFQEKPSLELYFGGLESIGFGRCRVFIQYRYSFNINPP